jgi:hypothetical protein
MVTRPVTPIPGDYRLYYEGIRDALLGKSPAPVTALAAWHVARLLEWAAMSSEQHREISCDWTEEPEEDLTKAANSSTAWGSTSSLPTPGASSIA